MALSRTAKEALKSTLAKEFQDSNATIIAEYSGLTMAQLTELRVKLREADANFKVVKNRVAKVAIKEDSPDSESLCDHLKGPVGVVFAKGDAAAAAKTVLDFQKENKDLFKVTAGIMDGAAVSVADLDAIASLPSKDVLLAQIIGSLVAPHKGIMGVLNGVPRQLVQVINAIKDTKAS
jgi:large subunit ribosomal protein L10